MMKPHYLFLLVTYGLLGTLCMPVFAATEHEGHHPAAAEQPTVAPEAKPMMMHKMMEMQQMPCMNDMSAGGMMGPDKMSGMMMPGMGNMMGSGMHMQMEHMLYLGQAEMLGLSADQVNQLKAIHTQCRKDNIRNMAEIKILKMDLADLVASDDWSLSAAEALVRKVQALEGDLHIRHLKAIHDAGKVLTPEQRQKAHQGPHPANLEELFQ